jgi:ribosomal-protein-alanine N-acetyltransferase
MYKFETTHLKFRLLTLEDLDAVMTFWGDEEVMAFCGHAGTREREGRAIAYYAKLDHERGYSVYGAFLKTDDTLIGACGFNPSPNQQTTDEAELIYHFAKNYWGQGYAREAAEGCIQLAKTKTHLKRLVATTHPQNTISQKVLKRCGFHETGMIWQEDLQQSEPCFALELKNS